MYTFLEVVNLALREVNEVPMTEQQLANARGLQQFAKETTNRAFFDISAESTKWPWLQQTTNNPPEQEVRKLTVGTQWYNTEIVTGDLKQEPDWNTFLLTDKDLTISNNPAEATIIEDLQFITYDQWISSFRKDDFAGKTGTPKYVVKYSSNKFGFSPVPDKEYSVVYNLRSSAVRFRNADDIIPIPEEFVNVLVSKIKYYLWLFRENDTQAGFSQNEYNTGLVNMKRSLLSNKEERMRAR